MTVLTLPRHRRTPYRTRTVGEPDPVPRAEPVVHGGVDDGPLDAERLATYASRGFLVFDGLFGADDVARLEGALQRVVQDPTLGDDERLVREPGGDAVRSVFEIHRLDPVFAELAADRRLLDPVRQILGSEVYLHQTRANLKPGFRGKEFFWHSDFETWHAEDGMPPCGR